MKKRAFPFSTNEPRKKQKNLCIEFFDLKSKNGEPIILSFYPNYDEYKKKGLKGEFNLDYQWFFDELSLGKIIERPNIIGKGVSGVVYNFKCQNNEYAVKFVTNAEISDPFRGIKSELILRIKKDLYKFSNKNPELKELRREVEIQTNMSYEGLAPKIYKFGFLLHKTKLGYYTHCFIVSEKFDMDVGRYLRQLKKDKDLLALKSLEEKLVDTCEKLSRSDYVCFDFKPENMVINRKTMDIKNIDFEGRFCISFRCFSGKVNLSYTKAINNELIRNLLKMIYLYLIVGSTLKNNIILCLKPMIKVWKQLKEPENDLLESVLNASSSGGENFANNIEHYFDKYQLFNLFRTLVNKKGFKREPRFIKKKDYPKIFNSMERGYKNNNFCNIL